MFHHVCFLRYLTEAKSGHKSKFDTLVTFFQKQSTILFRLQKPKVIIAGGNGSKKSSLMGELLLEKGVTCFKPDVFIRQLKKLDPNLSHENANSAEWTFAQERLAAAIEPMGIEPMGSLEPMGSGCYIDTLSRDPSGAAAGPRCRNLLTNALPASIK